MGLTLSSGNVFDSGDVSAGTTVGEEYSAITTVFSPDQSYRLDFGASRYQLPVASHDRTPSIDDLRVRRT